MDKTEEVEKIFERAYADYVPKKKKAHAESTTSNDTSAELEARLSHALLATCKSRLFIAGVARFLNTVLQFTFPILLNLILSYYQDVQSGIITPEDPPMVYYKGYWLSALLMMFVGIKAVTEATYFHLMNRCTWRCVCILCCCSFSAKSTSHSCFSLRIIQLQGKDCSIFFNIP